MSEIILGSFHVTPSFFQGGDLPFISSTLHIELLVENFTGASIFLNKYLGQAFNPQKAISKKI
jgi:hypothetical protein